jgi:hypothetical protein
MTAWEEIHGFDSPGEFARFEAWLASQIEQGDAEEIPVDEPYGSPYFTERWIRDPDTREVWRVVAPEQPFRGVFIPVEQESPRDDS